MHSAGRNLLHAAGLLLFSAAAVCAQPPGGQPQPEFIRQGQQLVRQGRLEDALALYRRELEKAPDSVPANTAAGVVLDLLGRGVEARRHFTAAIRAAATPQAKANAQRALAMSYAFEGDCANTVKAAQPVFDYYVSAANYYQQGEIADEAARVCLDSGDPDTAYKWYRIGHDAGLKEPNITPERAALWDFRWEHAQARIAARRGRQEQARQHMAAARDILDRNPEMAKAQAIFFPYLAGYVAFYGGDYRGALAELQKANQNDAFIQTLTGETYEKLGEREKAREYFRRAAAVTGHNPPAAYARRIAGGKLNGR